MQPVLFDTSIYIAALRLGDDAAISLRRIGAGTAVWLSAVVLEELYAGVNSADRRIVERLESHFERAGRIVVPNLKDWIHTGRVLALLDARYGHEPIGRGRLTNDALIALSAGRLGITVISANARDFGKLAEFGRFQWRISSLATG